MKALTRVLQLSRASAKHGLSPSRPFTHSAEWANKMRAASNITAPDEPPTSPLPEEHEIEGAGDFSNWVEPHNDVSLNQALIGMGSFFGFTLGLYFWSQRCTEEPKFTLKKQPTLAVDMPIVEEEFLYHKD